ncbi:DUF4435 domain-containing protein [Chromobacterium subtsugae]|uniref:DUF4435 domain-containing protein n=1 Tax=Chromobacterium subtsugae TaxID=251747 RepID=UPI0006414794|nr:DUF4435 domain-containing protein [Chromobacterium subtsugae]
MSKIDEYIAEIKTQQIGETGARVLIVEGPDDVDAYRILLERRHPEWERGWRIVVGGNKRQTLKIIEKEPTWLGLVDHDEWTQEERERNIADTPNLMVLPRFCLESYLIDPEELWQAFPGKQQNKIAGGLPQLQAALAQHKAAWLRHAALWHVINPLWRRLTAQGFTSGVLDPQNIPDDASLLQTLQSWHTTLDAQATLDAVHRQLAELQAMPDKELFASRIYSKAFYPQVVHRLLNDLLGQRPAKERRLAIFRTLPIPADLDPVWQRMGLMP